MKLICVLRLPCDKRSVGLQDAPAHGIIDVHEIPTTSKARPPGWCDRQSERRPLIAEPAPDVARLRRSAPREGHISLPLNCSAVLIDICDHGTR